MVSARQGGWGEERAERVRAKKAGGEGGRMSTNPAMFPKDESLPRHNPEMLFMAKLLIGALLRGSAEPQDAGSPLAVH